MRIPFCPFPIEKAKKAGKIFSGPAKALSKSSKLKLDLDQADIQLSPLEYVSIAFFSASFMAILSAVLFSLLVSLRLEVAKAASMGILVGLAVFAAVFLYIKAYPKLITKKKVRDVDRNLLSALKHMMVQIKSGVTTYDAFLSISRGEYGKLSEEFGSLVNKVDTGTPMESALEDLSIRNPSMNFRRTIWQVSNGMKAGSDIGDVLNEIIINLSQQKIVAIRNYGSQLNPLTLVYMMIAVILPALGITFLFIFSSFSPIPITETTFYIIIAALALMQFFYMGIIKSRRPAI